MGGPMDIPTVMTVVLDFGAKRHSIITTNAVISDTFDRP